MTVSNLTLISVIAFKQVSVYIHVCLYEYLFSTSLSVNSHVTVHVHARQWTKREKEHVDTLSEWSKAVRSSIQIRKKEKHT